MRRELEPKKYKDNPILGVPRKRLYASIIYWLIVVIIFCVAFTMASITR